MGEPGEIAEKPYRRWDVIESWMGALTGTCLAVGVFALFAFMASGQDGFAGSTERILGLASACVLLPFEILLLWSTWSTIRQRDFPLAFGVLRRQPRWPLPLRPFVSILWMLHFLAGLMMLLMSYALPSEGNGNGPGLDVTLMSIQLLMCFAIAYAANVFLLQAVAVFIRKDATLRRVWRHRLAFDLVVSLLAWWIGTKGFFD